MSDSPIPLDADAVADLKAPSLGAIVRWTRRAAKAKGLLTVCEHSLKHWLDRARDAHISALALPSGALQDHVEKQAPTRDVILAEEALAAAIEAADFADRMCLLLPQRLKDANNGQASGKPPLGVHNGGRQ